MSLVLWGFVAIIVFLLLSGVLFRLITFTFRLAVTVTLVYIFVYIVMTLFGPTLYVFDNGTAYVQIDDSFESITLTQQQQQSMNANIISRWLAFERFGKVVILPDSCTDNCQTVLETYTAASFENYDVIKPNMQSLFGG